MMRPDAVIFHPDSPKLYHICEAIAITETNGKILPSHSGSDRLAIQGYAKDRLSGFGGPEGFVDAFEQFWGIQRFAQTLVGSGLVRPRDVRVVTEGGEHDYVEVPVPLFSTEPAAQLQAVHAGHPEIQNDEIGFFFLDFLQSLKPVPGHSAGIPGASEQEHQGPGRRIVIFDDENLGSWHAFTCRDVPGYRAGFTGQVPAGACARGQLDSRTPCDRGRCSLSHSQGSFLRMNDSLTMA